MKTLSPKDRVSEKKRMWKCQVLLTGEGRHGLRTDQGVFGKARHWCPAKMWFHAEVGTDAYLEISQKYREFRKKNSFIQLSRKLWGCKESGGG